MLLMIIRHFSILYCSFYSYSKILNIKSHQFYAVLSSIIISISVCACFNTNYALRFIFAYISCILFITNYTNTKLSYGIIASTVSFITSYLSLAISCFIWSVTLAFTNFDYTHIYNIEYTILTGITHIALSILLFKIKRLKYGLPFIFENHTTYLFMPFCLFICTCIIGLHSLNVHSLSIKGITIFSALFLASLLLYWWRRKITQEYVEKLRLEEREELYNTISVKEQEIEKLQLHNEHLGRIIHKDNKLIPAMEYAVCNYLQAITEITTESGKQIENASSPPEQTLTPKQLLQLQQHGKDLILQLQQMASERDGILSTYEKNFTRHTQIGIASVDAVLQYMEKRAVSSHIRYRMKFDHSLKEMMLKHIEEHDVLHLLSDLIENAIIAVSHADKKEIQIHLGFSYDHLFFDIYDSGVPFTIETYQNFGNRPYTTHADSGGSGIGLTDIWNLKRKYKASLQIYEYPPGKDVYTKRIRILFDRKNHFLIQTYRTKEIRSNIIRNDLHVFPYSEHSAIDNAEENAVI